MAELETSRYRRRHPDRERRWDREDWWLFTLTIVFVGFIVASLVILSSANISNSPSFVKAENQMTKTEIRMSKTLQAEANAWNQIASSNKRLGHCYATDTACVKP